LNDLFQPLDASPAYRQIANLIERKIVERELRAGDPLPSENDLARQFGVNRSTVREAIRELEIHGLLGRQRGEKRLRVTRPEPERVISGVSRALALHDVTFLDLWETMMALEPAAAELAAARRSDTDIEALSAASGKFSANAADTPACVAAVAEFFAAVAAATGNQVLAMQQAPLNELLAPILSHMIDAVPQSRTRIIGAQTAMITAIRKRRREEARSWMEKHVRDFKRGYEIAGIPLEYSVSLSPR
jgi:GntR family transcriptional regulator, transcriptional repressor for pyruvate dehydrogenase complex